MASLSLIQEFNPEEIHRRLQHGFESGRLLQELHKMWALYVPFVYSNPNPVDVAREERKARRMLFRPMETFLCNSSDPDAVFRQLKDRDHPPQLCGKVFKNGEPTYSCRDCGMDPTCVLCIDCFQHSVHKSHRYKMATSGGGGYCDCGDREAWTTEPFCNIHKRGLNREAEGNPIELLPADLCGRARELFSCTVNYVVEILTWNHFDALPKHLRPQHTDSVYITMLFNDEVHTYEQVITTLQRAVDCSEKEAIDCATTVDREGRRAVKMGAFDECEKARTIIEKHTRRQNSKPLVVHVMHSSVVAHQQFAQKILTWLKNIIKHSDGLRLLLCEQLLKPGSHKTESIVEKLMLIDTKLWKAVRVASHQLFMSGKTYCFVWFSYFMMWLCVCDVNSVLMDQETKKQFAIIFTKLYPTLMAHFMEDDHDHAVCVVGESLQVFSVPTLCYPSLMRDFMSDDHSRSVSATSASVQMFTIPTVARMLIKDHNLIQVILDTFLQVCFTKLNKFGKLSLERMDGNLQPFKRAHYILFDLKYALVAKPSADEWNDLLRQNFLNGVHSLLKLLKMMEGMDAITRQTGQHVEFEPEWEPAFQLQFKLTDNIPLILDWCASDRFVLEQAFEASIQTLMKCKPAFDANHVTVELAGHRYECQAFDVSSRPVSIHLPVTRFVAGLYPFLNNFNISIPQLHQKLGCKASMLMEMSLRAQVLAAQCQAQMWRRNGYSLVNQVYFYHSVKCRSEMYDKDIIMLQAAAANMGSNEFLLHLLVRFGLHTWVKDEERTAQEELSRQVTVLAEEFLSLLNIIIGERHVPGVGMVTQDDQVKREIIHQLCIQPMSHSELSKQLPVDPYQRTGLEDVVHQVANFKRPSEMSGKGMYELKPEFYQQYNPLFYHFTRQEQSKSEESERKRRKQAGQGVALPPPEPVGLHPGFSHLVNLLQCDVMLFMLRVVLHRAQIKWSRCWSETQLEMALRLIGVALHEEKRAHQADDSSFNFTEKALQVPSGDCPSRSRSLHGLMESLFKHPELTQDSPKELLAWTLKKFHEVHALHSSSSGAEVEPLVVDSGDGSAERERKRRADMAAKRRAVLMARMSKMQKNFIKENAELYAATKTDLPARSASEETGSGAMNTQSGFPMAVGAKRTVSAQRDVLHVTCILCQESQDVTHNDRAMVLGAFIQKSTVLSKRSRAVLENMDDYNPLFMDTQLSRGAHTSTCGHVMHADCWQRYFDAILAKERRRTLRFRHQISYEVEKKEFLCPLCETLCNSVIPILPHLPCLVKDSAVNEVELSLDDWLLAMQNTVRNSVQEAKDKESQEDMFMFIPCPLTSVLKTMSQSAAKNFQLLFDYVYDDASAHFSDSITSMLRNFSTDVFAMGLGVNPDEEDSRVPVMAWSTCAYTIITVEQSLRDDNKALFGTLTSRQADCLSALVKFSAVCCQVIKPEVIKKHCVNLLSALVCESADKSLQETPCLLDMDMFHWLVELCFALPTLYAEDQEESSSKLTRIPTGGLNDHNTLMLAFTAHVVQVMLTIADDQTEDMDTDDAGTSDSQELLNIFLQLRKQSGLSGCGSMTPWRLDRRVKEAVMPFLRSAALFFHYLTGVSPPEALLIEGCGSEFELLCHYLALPPTITPLFHQAATLQQLVNSWCKNDGVQEKLSQAAAGKSSITSYPMSINQLIDLPTDYSELINKVSTFTCPKSDGDDSRSPTMCLVCGAVLCSQSYCCQIEIEGSTVGAATAHAHTCGAGTGVFLRVRECQILMLTGRTKGSFYAPPYLDDYGETDPGLRRGNPLHLCPNQYKKLQKLWLNHGIPEKIVHLLESNVSLMSIDWQHW